MRNLAKFIDRIIRLDPSLKPDLAPIKNKYARYPSKEQAYWTELLGVLNSSKVSLQQRSMIRGALARKQTPKKKHTFEAPRPNEDILGVIPENISDEFRSIDRTAVDLAKMSVVANMTHDSDMLLSLRKKSWVMDMKQKKAWKDIRDHFNLWDSIDNLTIRIKDNLLVLTRPKNNEMKLSPGKGSGSPNMSSIELINSDSGPLLKLSPDVLKAVFQFLGINPPPGMFDEQ